MLELLKPRAKTLDEFISLGRFFFGDGVDVDQAAFAKHVLAPEGMSAHLEAIATIFAELSNFDPASTEAALRAVAESRGVKAVLLIHAVRVAITGRSASPGLFEVAELIGRDRVHRRLFTLVRLISSSLPS